MTNPWLKKNPFMSMWLSAASRLAGTPRGQAKRQAHTAVTAATSENVKLMSSVPSTPASKRKPKHKR